MPRTIYEIFEDAKEIHTSRNGAYGESYKRFGPLMAALFPFGIDDKVFHSNEFGVFMMMVVKFHRLAMSNLTNRDSAQDMIVYSAMMLKLIEDRAENDK